jgi:hypothetical protein
MTLESVPSDDLQPAGMSELSRIAGVFVQPRKAFSDIAAHADWSVPLLLLIVSGSAFNLMMGQGVFLQQMGKTPQLQQLPADQRDHLLAMAQTFLSIIPYFAPIVITIALLVIALVVWGVTSGILSAPVQFGRVFAIVTYAELPGVLKQILTAIVVQTKGAADINLQAPLASSLGAFMNPQTTSKFIYTVASGLDLFSLWIALLIAVGLKAAAGSKVSFGGALFAAVSPFALIVLLSAAAYLGLNA